ncbi:unnamed protein product [Diatraea saccharalis]|uniref:Uncharacterized protein n=1 Tax=Diatraea saccharalis TaxID=40085 RepID=A0A9N9R6R7_9NEOP|nr:unnamed protein product [Diatraea saccharalis]
MTCPGQRRGSYYHEPMQQQGVYPVCVIKWRGDVVGRLERRLWHGEKSSNLTRATSRQLLAKANESARATSGVAGRYTSKLNKTDFATINNQLSVLMEVVAHLGLTPESSKNDIDKANTRAEMANVAWGVAAYRRWKLKPKM